MRAKESKWECVVCGWRGIDSQLLEAPSPFREDDTIIACPACKLIDGFNELCDIDGCTEPASGGYPMKNGVQTSCGDHADYIRTCHKHIPSAPKEEA